MYFQFLGFPSASHKIDRAAIAKTLQRGAQAASCPIVPHPISFRSNPRRRGQAALCCLLVLFTFVTTSSDAQEQKPRRRHAEEAIVALQPFSLDEPAPVRLAYYAPRAVPRAEPVAHDNDETDSVPKIGNNAAHPVISGRRAVLRNGIAYAPSNAPATVKSAIWATNSLRRKPYVWGGGHGSFNDNGYDCSGTVSFALYHAGLLGAPLPSNDFLRYGERGRGKWITIYARPGHTFAIIAGLRLDTTDLRYGTDIGPRWHTDFRDTCGFDARHPAGL